MEIEHVALLARLGLSESEKDLFSRQLGSILEYIETLNRLDTSDVAPTAHVLPVTNVFREDILQPSLPVGQVLQNAPEHRNGHFSVPKIIE